MLYINNNNLILLLINYIYFISFINGQYMLDINCTHNCVTYISNIIQSYTGSGQYISVPPSPYSANVIPINMDKEHINSNNDSDSNTDDYKDIKIHQCKYVKETPHVIGLDDDYTDNADDDNLYIDKGYNSIKVEFALLFQSIVGIDMIAGTLTLSINIDMFWKDQLINWNSYKAGNISHVMIPSSWLWMPDIALVNSATNFIEGVTETNLKTFANGLIWSSNPATINPTCTFDLSLFPFDVQECELIFSSNIYTINELNLELYPYNPAFMDNFGLLIDDTFFSNEYKIKNIKSARQLCFTAYGYIPQLIYTISLKRYSSYYYVSAILPNIIITIIAILALFINDISSRLGVAITALLAIVAVMVKLL